MGVLVFATEQVDRLEQKTKDRLAKNPDFRFKNTLTHKTLE